MRHAWHPCRARRGHTSSNPLGRARHRIVTHQRAARPPNAARRGRAGSRAARARIRHGPCAGKPEEALRGEEDAVEARGVPPWWRRRRSWPVSV